MVLESLLTPRGASADTIWRRKKIDTQKVSADAPRGVSKDSKTIYATPMESKFGIDFM